MNCPLADFPINNGKMNSFFSTCSDSGVAISPSVLHVSSEKDIATSYLSKRWKDNGKYPSDKDYFS
jgi:hypothetical protein